jgi:hypothetical protein
MRRCERVRTNAPSHLRKSPIIAALLRLAGIDLAITTMSPQPVLGVRGGEALMEHIRRLVVATTAAVALVATSSGAQQHDQHRNYDKWGDVGQQVMLTSCVEKGMKDDTFILTHVADVPGHPPTMGRVVYWLDKTKDLKKHVGHQIRVTGKISEVKQSEMEALRTS